MKRIFELNEHDIEVGLKAYYESFNEVKVKEVKLIHYTNTEGYGMGEHDVPRVKVEIVEE
jgi:hypothetical protein